MRVDLDEVERRLERAVDKESPNSGAKSLLIHCDLPALIEEVRLHREIERALVTNVIDVVKALEAMDD
jgi:hypothetical protein